jgi:cyclic-di-GMP-binding biofilm dispersal mediator protein
MTDSHPTDCGVRSLAGASIILVGASGGIGCVVGRKLEKEGARLTLFGRDAERLEKIGLSGPRVVGDLADSEACAEAVWTAMARYGCIDGLVNAAGVVAFGPVASTTDEAIEALIRTNLIGPLRMMRAVIPEMERGGFIANLSAIVAERPMANMALYSATKAGLSALDEALARELRSRRIDVIDLRPPHTETGLAGRPIAGAAPRLPAGLAPEDVAERILRAIVERPRIVHPTEF